jgi:hypothetical protein
MQNAEAEVQRLTTAIHHWLDAASVDSGESPDTHDTEVPSLASGSTAQVSGDSPTLFEEAPKKTASPYERMRDAA